MSGTDTQSVVDAKQQTGDLYSFLAWLEPYIKPRRSSTNLLVVEAKDSDAQDDEVIDIEVDSMSTSSSTPDPDPLYTSKDTGRSKYLHTKRPEPADHVGFKL